MMLVRLMIALLLGCTALPLHALELEDTDAGKTNQSIFTLQIAETEHGIATARFKGLTRKAREMGFSKLTLRGKVQDVNLPGGQHNISITWDDAVLGHRETSLSTPFLSKFQAPRMIEPRDTVRAMGDPMVLMEAYNRLSEADKEEDEEEEDEPKQPAKAEENKPPKATGASAAPGGSTAQSYTKPQEPQVSTNFEAKTKDPVPQVTTTSEGCEIRIDTGQQVAIVQERTLTDGKETTPCADSLTRYPITKDYTTCDPKVDIAAMRVMEQYTLGYHNPATGGRVEIAGCSEDGVRFQGIVETKEGCPILPVEDGVIEQVRLIYTVNGVEHEVQGCADKDIIITTFDGCEIDIDEEAGKAIAYERVIINGEVTEDCHESATEYTLVEDYDACKVDVAIEELRAYKQYTLGYTRDHVRVVLGSCRRDAEDFYPVLESEDRCSPKEMEDGWLRQARLLYTVDGVEHEVRACQDIGTLQKYTDTEDGCQLRHDFDTGKSYVQKKRVYEYDGKVHEVRGCTDSEVSYDHRAVTEGCAIREDIQAMQAIQQARIVIDVEDAELEISHCKDSDIAYPISMTEDGCTLRHDFDAGLSYQQHRAVYSLPDTTQVEVQSCDDDTEHYYHHEITQEECEPIVRGGKTVTFQEQTVITVDGQFVSVSPCRPDESTTTEVSGEYCNTPTYTHDMGNGQSYRNKQYFYTHLGRKTYVTDCIRSDETLNHEEDSNLSDCPMEHNDENRTSQIYGKYYIEDGGTRIYLDDCHPVGNPIAYISAGKQWQKLSSKANTPIDVYNDWRESKTVMPLAEKGKHLWAEWSWDWLFLKDPWGMSYDYQAATKQQSWASFTIESNAKYCLNGRATTPWSHGGETIDSSNSDQAPKISKPKVSGCNALRLREINQCQANAPAVKITYSCPRPTCTLTTLEAHPVFKRPDGSQFVDGKVVAARKLVCGSGNTLDGKIK